MEPMGRQIALVFVFSERVGLLLAGASLLWTTIFYLLVATIRVRTHRYQLAYMPTLGKSRWVRYLWLAFFLLAGSAMVDNFVAISSTQLPRVTFFSGIWAVILLPLVLCFLLLLRATIADLLRALHWRRYLHGQQENLLPPEA